MDQERFQTLAEAYGGDLGRWPPVEQAAARAHLAASAEAAAVLADAEALDAALDLWRVAAPSAALRDRVLASAPRRRRVRPRFGLWLSGAGFAAAAAAAGLIVGLTASSAVVSAAQADGFLSTAFSSDTGALLVVGAAGVRDA